MDHKSVTTGKCCTCHIVLPLYGLADPGPDFISILTDAVDPELPHPDEVTSGPGISRGKRKIEPKNIGNRTFAVSIVIQVGEVTEHHKCLVDLDEATQGLKSAVNVRNKEHQLPACATA
jgi:hypothetical protein